MSNASTKIPKWHMHLEDTTIEGHAATYPPEIRENFIWIAVYLREVCNRNLDVLEAHIRKLEFDLTGGTISKMLLGRWNKNAEGETVPPCCSIRNFNDVVTALRKDAQISELAGKVPFIETQTWDDFKAYVDVRRAPEQICKFGLGIGPTGSQKTACAQQYQIRNNHGRCYHMEAPDTATMSKFVTEMGALFGVSAWSSSQAKRVRIRENLNEKKTVFIDNIQRLYKPNSGWNQPILNALQAWQDMTRCTFILLCVPEWELISKIKSGSRADEVNYFEQFVGRCGGVDEFFTFPDYAPKSDLKRIAQAFRLKDYERHIGTLQVLCQQRGRIRVLFNVLQKAKRISEAEGSKQLRIGDIHAALGTMPTLMRAVREAEEA